MREGDGAPWSSAAPARPCPGYNAHPAPAHQGATPPGATRQARRAGCRVAARPGTDPSPRAPGPQQRGSPRSMMGTRRSPSGSTMRTSPEAPASETGWRDSSVSQRRTRPSREAAASTWSTPAIATTPPWCGVWSWTSMRVAPAASPSRSSRVTTRRPPSRTRPKRTRLPASTPPITAGERAGTRIVMAGIRPGMSSCAIVSQGPRSSIARRSPSRSRRGHRAGSRHDEQEQQASAPARRTAVLK